MVNYDWLKTVSKEFKHYYLQIANCERLRINNVVLLFDESGCGKTLSCGLMTLDYLYNNPDKKVLVITSVVASTQSNGLDCFYFNYWSQYLPELKEYRNQITFTSNENTCLESLEKEFDLIIVEDVHMFSNQEAKRTCALLEFRCSKLILVSGTPVVGGTCNYINTILQAIFIESDDYIDYLDYLKYIAGCLDALPFVNWCVNPHPQSADYHGLESDVLVCSYFNTSYPLTRYTDGIMNAITTNKNDSSNVAMTYPTDLLLQSNHPLVEDADTASRLLNTLVGFEGKFPGVKGAASENLYADNHYIIYCNTSKIPTALVVQSPCSVSKIETAMKAVSRIPSPGISGVVRCYFKDIRDVDVTDLMDVHGVRTLTYDIIDAKANGSVDRLLAYFNPACKLHRPKVLVIESDATGCVDLSGMHNHRYNVVVNWYVPQDYNLLENRFGRTCDISPRFNSGKRKGFRQDESIIAEKWTHMSYVLDTTVSNSNTRALLRALATFRNKVLPVLPSRNRLFGPATLANIEQQACVLKSNIVSMRNYLAATLNRGSGGFYVIEKLQSCIATTGSILPDSITINFDEGEHVFYLFLLTVFELHGSYSSAHASFASLVLGDVVSACNNYLGTAETQLDGVRKDLKIAVASMSDLLPWDIRRIYYAIPTEHGKPNETTVKSIYVSYAVSCIKHSQEFICFKNNLKI